MTAPVPPGPRAKRVWRSGVRFDCPDCGLLWRDDAAHGEIRSEPCGDCGGVVRLVGVGDAIVESAKWYRCLTCSQLWMWRRRELGQRRAVRRRDEARAVQARQGVQGRLPVGDDVV